MIQQSFSLVFTQKKISSHSPWYLPRKKLKFYPHKSLYMDIYSNFVILAKS